MTECSDQPVDSEVVEKAGICAETEVLLNCACNVNSSLFLDPAAAVTYCESLDIFYNLEAFLALIPTGPDDLRWKIKHASLLSIPRRPHSCSNVYIPSPEP